MFLEEYTKQAQREKGPLKQRPKSENNTFSEKYLKVEKLDAVCSNVLKIIHLVKN